MVEIKIADMKLTPDEIYAEESNAITQFSDHLLDFGKKHKFKLNMFIYERLSKNKKKYISIFIPVLQQELYVDFKININIFNYKYKESIVNDTNPKVEIKDFENLEIHKRELVYCIERTYKNKTGAYFDPESVERFFLTQLVDYIKKKMDIKNNMLVSFKNIFEKK